MRALAGNQEKASVLAWREMYEALVALRSFMWSEGYADQVEVMAKADAAIATAERAQPDAVNEALIDMYRNSVLYPDSRDIPKPRETVAPLPAVNETPEAH